MKYGAALPTRISPDRMGVTLRPMLPPAQGEAVGGVVATGLDCD